MKIYQLSKQELANLVEANWGKVSVNNKAYIATSISLVKNPREALELFVTQNNIKF